MDADISGVRQTVRRTNGMLVLLANWVPQDSGINTLIRESKRISYQFQTLNCVVAIKIKTVLCCHFKDILNAF